MDSETEGCRLMIRVERRSVRRHACSGTAHPIRSARDLARTFNRWTQVGQDRLFQSRRTRLK
jgi:hypothetical protein